MKTIFNVFAGLTGNVRRLRHITRYSSFPCLKPESVAEHSWQVTFVTYLLAHDLIRRGLVVNIGLALSKAIVHDLSESMSGDIIRTYKYSSEQMRSMCEAADIANMGILLEDYGALGEDIWEDWVNAKDDTLEGKIVRFADLVVVTTYCAEEWHLGNRQMDGTLERAYRTTISAYHDNDYFGKYADQLFPNRDWRDAYRRDPDAEGYQGRGDAYGAAAQLRQTREPAARWVDGIDGGPERSTAAGSPLMRDHSEGPVAGHEFKGEPSL